MQIVIDYRTRGGSGRCVLNALEFFPNTKEKLRTLKRRIIDLEWSWMTKQDYYRQMLEAIREVRRRTILEQKHTAEEFQTGNMSKYEAGLRMAHFRRALQQLDHNQEVVEAWQREPK